MLPFSLAVRPRIRPFGPKPAITVLEPPRLPFDFHSGGTQTMNWTDPVTLSLLAGLILAIGIVVWMYFRRTRTQKLRSKFGPEYDKAIAEHRDRGHAESELEKRAARV